MNEEELKRDMRESLRARSSATPDFERVWRAAEARYLDERRQLRRNGGLVAAAIVVALVIALRPDQPPATTPLIEVGEDLLSSTLWTAPSDVLIPKRDYDIYHEIPSLMESTKLEEGSLL